MTINEVAKQLNRKLINWNHSQNKLVVAIDGYTGVGKTTLLSKLAAINSDVLPVNRDDFQIPRVKFDKLYKNVNNRPRLFELEMNDTKKLNNLIKAFRKSNRKFKIKAYDGVSGKITIPKVYDFSKKIIVIEGVFLLHPKLLDRVWDKRIYLKSDLNKIKKRRIAREKKRWSKGYFAEDHPDSYFRQVMIALDRYIKLYNPEKRADIVFNID